MQWHSHPEALMLVFSGVLSLLVAYLVRQRRTLPGGASFAATTVAAAIWAFFQCLEVVSPDIPRRIYWTKWEYFGVISLPIFWFMFALQYARLDVWLTRRNLVLLWAVPLLTLVMCWTNEYHHLHWTHVTWFSNSPTANLVFHRGAWFWVFVAYSYLLLATGTVTLLWTILRSPRAYRDQIIPLLVAVFFPWAANMIYMVGQGPLQGMDITPLAFPLTGLTIIYPPL